MNYIILLFGLLIVLLGGLLLIQPKLILDPLRSNADTLLLHIVAVAVRLLLGSALVLYSGSSRFPVVLEILGWLTITAALVLWAMGRANFQAMMAWALNFTSTYSRIGGGLTMCFGAFLVYAVI